MTDGAPVYITGSGGSPVFVAGAGAKSIPATALGSMTEFVLFSSSIPFIFASSGSMGNNGALTGLTSLVNTYPNAYILIPIAGIDGTNPLAATWYYFVGSSGTAGTVYNNVYTSGQPSIPGTPTAFATTGPGAITGVSAATIAQSYSMPGLTMGFRDTVRISYKASTTNSANNKILTQLFGGTATEATTVTSIASSSEIIDVTNRDVTNVQIAAATGQSPQQSANNFNLLAIDTTMAVTIAMQGTNGTVATNNIVMESVVIELLKGS